MKQECHRVMKFYESTVNTRWLITWSMAKEYTKYCNVAQNVPNQKANIIGGDANLRILSRYL
jgi:hypothetical protein